MTGYLGSEGLLLPPTLPPTVTPDRFYVIAGDPLTTAIIGAPPHDTGVWLALAWQYLSGTQVPPGSISASTDTELTFSAPMLPGSYRFRLMSTAGHVLAYSDPVEVGELKLRARDDIVGRVDPDSGDLDVPVLSNDTWPAGTAPIIRIVAQNEIGYPATVVDIDGVPYIRISTTTVALGPPAITITATDVLPSTVIDVEVVNGPGNTADWVALFDVGETNPNNFWDWQYLNGVKNQPDLPLNNSILTFTLPDVDGTYEFRFFLNNTTEVIVTSEPVTVTTPPLPIPVPIAVNDVRRIESYETVVIAPVLANDYNAAEGIVTVPGGITGNATFTIDPADQSIHVTRTGLAAGSYALTYVVTTPGGVSQAPLVGTIEAFVEAVPPVAHPDVMDMTLEQRAIVVPVLENDEHTFEAVVTIDDGTLLGARAEVLPKGDIRIFRIGFAAGPYSLTYRITTAGGEATATLSGEIAAYALSNIPVTKPAIRNLSPSEVSGAYRAINVDPQDLSRQVSIEGEVIGATAEVSPEIFEPTGLPPMVIARTIIVTRIGTAAGTYTLTYRVTNDSGYSESTLSGDIAEYAPPLQPAYDYRNITNTETTFLYNALENWVYAEGGIVSVYGSTVGVTAVTEGNQVRITRLSPATGGYYVSVKVTKGTRFAVGSINGNIDEFGSTAPPIAHNDTRSFLAQRLVHTVNVLDNDTHVGGGVVTIVSATNVEATVPDGQNVRIARIGEQTGPYSVTYRVTTQYGSATAELTGNIPPYEPSSTPTANPDVRNITANETTVLVDVLANDLDTFGAVVRIVGGTTIGVLANVEDNYIRLTRIGTAAGSYSLLYEAFNDAGGHTAVVGGSIAAFTTPAAQPTANPDVRDLSASETSVLVNVIGNDILNGFPGLISVPAPATGSATATRVGNEIRITRIGTAAGSYNVVYRLSTSGGFNDATLSGTIAAFAATLVPIAHDDTRNVGAGESTNILVNVLANDENAVGGTVTIPVPGSTTGITATVAGNQIRLDRIGVAAGPYSVTYQVATASGSDTGVLSGTVAAFTSAISLSASPTSVATGGQVVVTFANGPGSSRDWIGMYALAETNFNNIAFNKWWYLNQTQFTPPTPGLTNGSVTFTLSGVTAGSYIFRLFPNDAITPVLAVSQTVVVT